MPTEQLAQEWIEKISCCFPQKRIPWLGQWELTCRCNLKCVMCYTDPFNTPERIRQELPTSEILRILDEIHEAGCMELVLTGGEPLSRPDFLEIYQAAHQKGFLITIFTNGTRITEEIFKCWSVMRPKSVEISLHGVSAEVFDGVTQMPGSFDRCLQWIRRLMEAHIPLVLKTVGLTVNKEEVLAIKRFANSLGSGVQWKFGQYLRNDLVMSDDPFRFQLSEEELQKIEREDPELWKAKHEEMTDLKSASPKCGGSRDKFHIDAYGQLQLCSSNRIASYDLRKGSFKEGFYEMLPTFPCPRRQHMTSEDKAMAPENLEVVSKISESGG